ncbi:beta-glucoside-specific PTS transporter subunit IIABC [Oceanobacillus oncorhynchi]|uniref:beta-glucoside-specific PTS transporter subunit IIABC n=1 Tax=Oceanobacillus oncorhynchi TaxID=545501 RepID=UPI0025A3D50D|nr:beta-glucoside-specific PTS transporter subunit IIABC [Oceanobacillus oncorhynchi]MDM8101661.1 beta-glucoside-specific PTS transporter subunit IIABC [Oceanobacillus oncorhynchi]
MDNKELGNKIIDLVGGEENVDSLVHCATRLRFQLKDHGKVNKAELSDIPEVLSIVEQGGQFQVVIGKRVGKVYTEIVNNHSISSGNSEGNNNDGEKVGVMEKVFGYISGTFSPLLPALAGSGMIKALLAILDILNWIDIEGSTYAVLNAASNAVFYFLPIFVGISAAKKLGANPFVGGVIAAGLMEPSFAALLEVNGNLDFMGIPLIVADYSSTVFPLLIAIAILAPIERFLKRISPDTIQLFFVSMVSILIMVPLTALVFGPFSEYLSVAIGSGIAFMLDFSAVLTGILIASAWPLVVILGVHWGVVPIMIDNFARGGDMINPITAASVFAQIGIAFGIFLRTRKDKDLRSLSLATTLSGLFAGVTEPILYGLILRYKRLIPIVLVSGGVGGVIIALFNVRVSTFILNNIFTIPVLTPTTGYVLGIGASFITAALLTFIFGIEGRNKDVEKVTEDKENLEEAGVTESNNASVKNMEVTSPIKGEIIPLEKIDDPVFSSAAMGKGVGIEPKEGTVFAPFDGKVATLFPTGHAIGLRSKDGVEVLVHIGLDTVQLEGKHFEIHVEADSTVKKGDKLITFDIQGIKDAGYKTTTPVIITNTDNYSDIQPTENRDINIGENLLSMMK